MLQYIVNKYFPSKEEAQKQIEFVISTEPTDGGIYRGHRGRMEIRVDVKGVSCHGSAPERGDNAIYKMADILQDVRALNENDDADSTEIKGLVKMLNPKYNPEHYEDARFWAVVPAPPARSSTPPPAAAPWPTAAPSLSTAA